MKVSSLSNLLFALVFWVSILLTLWAVWVSWEVKSDFKALEWELPGRVFAKSLTLNPGSSVSMEVLLSHLRRLGYQKVDKVERSGEYAAFGRTVVLYTHGYQFYDGTQNAAEATLSYGNSSLLEIRDKDGQPLRELRLEPLEIAQINPITGEDRLPLRLVDTPQLLIDALLATEDRRFYDHWGIDPLGIARAMLANLRAGRIVQGGSTLTQQLVKNLYLSRERNLYRKLEELIKSLALEFFFSKAAILEAYLNEVYLGQDGGRAIHGFALASEYYFARPLKELKVEELALLVGIGKGASYYNPRRYPERAFTRRTVVLQRMAAEGKLSPIDLQRASSSALGLVATHNQKPRSAYADFLELMYDELAREYNREALQSEGLRIFTTLDVVMQDTLSEIIRKQVPELTRRDRADEHPLQAAAVISEPETGEIRALLGSSKGGYTGFNRALRARRPVGSLVKPPLYLAAIDSGEFHLSSVLADTRVSIRLPTGQYWRPENFENAYDGPVFLFDALQRSLNSASVDLSQRLGIESLVSMLRRLGYTGPVDPYPALALGAVEMSPLEVAQIYTTLAARGRLHPLRAVLGVTTQGGFDLQFEQRSQEKASQVISATSVYLLEQAMQGVLTRGTAKSQLSKLEASLPLAGKTGTTNDLRDSWFAGYGENLVGVFWVGYDDNAVTGLTGANGALKLWASTMTQLGIEPRLPEQPLDIEWLEVPALASWPESEVNTEDCRLTQRLPYQLDAEPPYNQRCSTSVSNMSIFRH